MPLEDDPTKSRPAKPIYTGHVWSDFLLARKRVIEWLIEDGKGFVEVADTLSMDAMQVNLIHLTNESEIDR